MKTPPKVVIGILVLSFAWMGYTIYRSGVFFSTSDPRRWLPGIHIYHLTNGLYLVKDIGYSESFTNLSDARAAKLKQAEFWASRLGKPGKQIE